MKLVLEKFDSGMHYVMLHEQMVAPFLIAQNKRVLCRLNAQVTFHAAIMAKKEGGYYINIGTAICKQLNLKIGDEVALYLSKDDTECQFFMPETLQAVLDTDEEADAVFRSLTRGNQRSLMYLVNQVKSTDKQIERALKIASQLKLGITNAKVILK